MRKWLAVPANGRIVRETDKSSSAPTVRSTTRKTLAQCRCRHSRAEVRDQFSVAVPVKSLVPRAWARVNAVFANPVRLRDFLHSFSYRSRIRAIGMPRTTYSAEFALPKNSSWPVKVAKPAKSNRGYQQFWKKDRPLAATLSRIPPPTSLV